MCAIVEGMKYSFTGTRSLKPVHVRAIDEMLAEDCSDGTHFFTGCARGVDTYVARRLTTLYPHAHHTLIVPGWDRESYNAELVDGWMPSDRRHIVYMPRARSMREAMRERNEALVARCDRLLGLALYEEDRQPYSGTWQTVRIGRRQGRLQKVMVLEPLDRPVTESHAAVAPARGRNRRQALSG